MSVFTLSTMMGIQGTSFYDQNDNCYSKQENK
jgi:hypothetical protein